MLCIMEIVFSEESLFRKAILMSDFNLAQKLLKRAIVLDPKESDWSRDLAWSLSRNGKNKIRRKAAMAAMQDAIRKTKGLEFKYSLYDDLATMAFEAGELKIAESAERKAISLVGKFGDHWNDGNALHAGNCILGRIVLKQNKLDAAVFHLKEAGSTPGSPQLDSFGPDMTFANEMLAAGQTKAVVDYLKSCKRFWDGESAKLSGYIARIKRGEIPDLNRFS